MRRNTTLFDYRNRLILYSMIKNTKNVIININKIAFLIFYMSICTQL